MADKFRVAVHRLRSVTASTLLMFGATGDLARRMLLPSLFMLDTDGLLADDFRIVGTARSGLDDVRWRELAAHALDERIDPARRPTVALERFLGRLHYRPLDVTQPDAFTALAGAAGGAAWGDVAIVLSTAPSLFAATVEGLKRAGLAGPLVRLALEKPLGHDLASSRAINDTVASAFTEAQTFRIDHYLGKETVQNLLALRFGNALFEPLWNASHIEHVQITVAETVGLEGRGDYYDGAGALRDMVQNHMLQLLSLVAMEPPARFEAEAVRDEKVKALRALRSFTAETAAQLSVTGQYRAGADSGGPVPGYAEELGRASGTETFVALMAHVDNWRWRGVPFFLRTGKCLPERRTEIVIRFRPAPHSIFPGAQLEQNQLIIALQPDENIRLTLMAKQPGLDRGGVKLREVPLDVGLADAFADTRRRIAYERLLLDVIEGRPTLFVRRDEVEAQWAFVDSIRHGWAAAGVKPKPYIAGTWGPAAAIALAERQGASWRE